MSSERSNSIVQFGAFEVDLQAHELRKSGMKIKIQEQPFQVLVLLLEHRETVLTREEIRARLWSNGTFVDFEHGLNAAVKRLRDALGDEAENPRFIETIPRRGYRFIAPVDAPSVTIKAAARPRRSLLLLRPSYWLLAIAVVVVLSILLLWRGRFNQKELAERQITANPSDNPVLAAVLSPDGRYLAFTDTTGVYVRLIRTGETHQLLVPSGSLVRPSSWFPDGTHLLATVEGTAAPKLALWTLSLLGGPPRELISDGACAAISADGAYIAFLRGVPSRMFVSAGLPPWGFGREIWSMRADGTEQRLLASAVGGEWLGSINWSLDLSQIAYVRTAFKQGASVRVVDLHEHRTKEVLSGVDVGTAIYWSPERRLFYVLEEKYPNSNDRNIWAVSLRKSGDASGPRERITRGHGFIIAISGGPDGALAFWRVIAESSIHLHSLMPDSNSVREKRLIPDDSSPMPYSWTADSKGLVFISRRNGTRDIFKQDIDQSLAESIVVTSDRSESMPRLNPDGTEIIYTSTSLPSATNSPVSLLAVPVSGGAPRFILKDQNITNQQCARNGSRVCIYSQITTQQEVFYKFDPDTGEASKVLVIDTDMAGWSLSPDGKTLAVMDFSGPETAVQLHSISSGEKREIKVVGWPKLESVDWAADGKSVFVATSAAGGDSSLLNITMDGTVKVLRYKHNQIVHWAIPSPNGRWLAIFESVFSSNVWAKAN